MRFFCLVLLLFSFALFSKEKKILIFSCSCGGGHMATAQALKDFLSDQYDVVIVSPNDERYPFSTRLYSYHLANGNYRILNFNHSLMNHGFPLFSFFEDPDYFLSINRYIEREKPDLLISVVPFANHLCVDAVNEHKLPFLIVTSDHDSTFWVNGLKKRDLSRVNITIGRDLPFTKTWLLQNGFSLNQIHITGLPVRSDFFEPKDKKRICEKFSLPQDKQKILIMFGGAGSTSILDYVDSINKNLSHCHLITCTGKNDEVAYKLKKMVLKNNNTLTIVGFTRQISDYMASSDLFITKAGPGTIEEALIMKLPILIDGTKPFLSWEKMNADLVLAYQVGSIVNDLKLLPTLLLNYLNNSARVQEAYSMMAPNEFPIKIKTLIDSLIK